VEFEELRNSASTFIRALLRGSGDGAQTFDLLFEGLAGHWAGINDTTISRSPHQRSISLTRGFVRGRRW
jgi:hypothetical protein